MPIRYSHVLIHKREWSDVMQLTSRLSRELGLVITSNQEFFSQFKKVIIYYDNGQAELTKVFTPTFGREAIQKILASAKDHEFDILLVFTLDRLSRRDYEFPMLIEQITENGFSIWSVKDGECSYRTPTDHLLVYLAGWRASLKANDLEKESKQLRHRWSHVGSVAVLSLTDINWQRRIN